VDAGDDFSCAIVASGKVKCWGRNDSGQLGLGDTQNHGDEASEMGDALPFVDLGKGVAASVIAAGNTHTCVVVDPGKVKCWGTNTQGQLGLGDTVNRGDAPGQMGRALPYVDLGTGQKAMAVVAGSLHSCALLENGKVKCWGDSGFGQLGQGDNVVRGDGPGEMGDALPYVDLGAGLTATSLTAGGGHTCARLSSGKVKCWGLNEEGEFGVGDEVDRGGKPGQMGDLLPFADLGTGNLASQLDANYLQTCVQLVSGQLKCWGLDTVGQLGQGDQQGKGLAPGNSGDNLPAIDLGTGVLAASVAVGGLHTCARVTPPGVKCWGSGTSGQLGLGDTSVRGNEPGEMGDALPLVDLGPGLQVSALSAGNNHSCVLLAAGRLKCWGANESGQLGLGDTENRGDNAGEMGDNLPVIDLGTMP
jgi:hypothetical protein